MDLTLRKSLNKKIRSNKMKNKDFFRILVIDTEQSSLNNLKIEFKKNRSIENSAFVNSLTNATIFLSKIEINVIFIDPFSIGIRQASNFVFKLRISHPQIVFVLYFNHNINKAKYQELYKGNRQRFTHYYKLNKQDSSGNFQFELNAVLNLCEYDLRWKMSEDNITALLKSSKKPQSKVLKDSQTNLLNELREMLETFKVGYHATVKEKRSVFFSHRFEEREYLEGLSSMLKSNKFKVVTGGLQAGSISVGIKEQIKQCEFYLCLMTKYEKLSDGSYITSPWLIEEKAVALAYQKPIILMVENGVKNIGGLHGDWQIINFSEKSFTTACVKTIEVLKSYAGGK